MAEIKRPWQADRVLEFCKTPRTAGEIATLICYKAVAHVRKIILAPLIATGEIKLTIPDKPLNRNQRFVTAGFEAEMITIETILQYCMVPRRKNEIAAHFKQTKYQIRFLITALIESGKLLPCDNSVKNNAMKRFVSADAGCTIDRVEQVKQFCQVPRLRKEIADFLNLSKTAVYEFLKVQVNEGNLKLLMPERPQSTDQRFVASEVDICILTVEDISEFCQTERTRAEIAERYGLSRRTAATYIHDFIQRQILNYTIPEYTLSKFQKYIAVTGGR